MSSDTVPGTGMSDRRSNFSILVYSLTFRFHLCGTRTRSKNTQVLDSYQRCKSFVILFLAPWVYTLESCRVEKYLPCKLIIVWVLPCSARNIDDIYLSATPFPGKKKKKKPSEIEGRIGTEDDRRKPPGTFVPNRNDDKASQFELIQKEKKV